MLRRVFILTYQGLHFSKDLCPKFNCLCSFLNFSYSSICVISRRCLTCGSRSFEPILSFSTSFWFEEGLVLSCQKLCTSPVTASTSFMSRCGNRPIKAQKICLIGCVKMFSTNRIPTEVFYIQINYFACRHEKTKELGVLIYNCL